jgi:hypothetical protein
MYYNRYVLQDIKFLDLNWYSVFVSLVLEVDSSKSKKHITIQIFTNLMS